MLPFVVRFKNGKPVHEQVLLAVKRALTTGQLQPGDRFPSVRALSQELRINPNTAHKIIGSLIESGLLNVQPGVGTIVCAIRPASAQQKQELLAQDIERLVVEARMLGLGLADLLPAVQKNWQRLVKE